MSKVPCALGECSRFGVVLVGGSPVCFEHYQQIEASLRQLGLSVRGFDGDDHTLRMLADSAWLQSSHAALPGALGPAVAGLRASGRQAAPLVLVIDDDPYIARLIAAALGDHQLEVQLAEDGPHALNLAATRRPDLVILDIMLPGLAGDDVADALRQLYGPDLPILVISAFGEIHKHAYRAGAYSQLDKPFELEDLVLAVSSGLERAGRGGH